MLLFVQNVVAWQTKWKTAVAIVMISSAWETQASFLIQDTKDPNSRYIVAGSAAETAGRKPVGHLPQGSHRNITPFLILLIVVYRAAAPRGDSGIVFAAPAHYLLKITVSHIANSTVFPTCFSCLKASSGISALKLNRVLTANWGHHDTSHRVVSSCR